MAKQRLFAVLLMLGSSILLYQTIHLLAEGILIWATWWISVLLFVELLIDLGCLISSVWWYRSNESSKDRLPLRLGTAAALFHALRVLIFVMGRTGPWINFDVKPEYHSTHHETLSWGGVYFASAMSLLGIMGVVVIWRIRVRNRRRK